MWTHVGESSVGVADVLRNGGGGSRNQGGGDTSQPLLNSCICLWGREGTGKGGSLMEWRESTQRSWKRGGTIKTCGVSEI